MSRQQGRHRMGREQPSREGLRERVVPALWGANGTLAAAAVVTLLVGGAEPRDVLADPPTFGPSESGPRGSGGGSAGDAAIVPVASEVTPDGGGLGRAWPGAGWAALWADGSTPGSFAALCDGLTSVRVQPASAASLAGPVAGPWAGPVAGQPASDVPAAAGASPAPGAAPAGAPPASSGGSTGSSPTAPTAPQSGTPVVTAPAPGGATLDPVVDAAKPVVDAAKPVVETVVDPVEKVVPAPVTQTVEELPVAGGLLG